MRAALPAAAAAALAPLAGGSPAAAQSRNLAEVVVTAAPYAVSIGSSTSSIEVVEREQLEAAPSAGLGDTLAALPGVRSSFFGPGAGRPVIRGLSGPRVLVLANGVGLIDASALSPDHQVASDPQEAERIEVLRGPAALAYGGSAIGGVVNVIDQRIPEAFAAGLQGRLSGSAASVDEGRAAAVAFQAGFGGRWTLTLDGLRRETDDYDAPVEPTSRRLAAAEGLPPPGRGRRKVANSHASLDAYGGGFSYVGERAWGGLAAKRTRSDYGSPAEADVGIALAQTRIDARGGLELPIGPFHRARFAAGFADYKHTEREAGEPATRFFSDGLEGRLELIQQDRGGWQGALGLQALRRDLKVLGDEALIPSTRMSEAGGFLMQRLDRQAWGVEGGLRIDSRRLDSAAGERAYTNLSGSIGAFTRPAEGWFFGLSLFRASRAPTEEELFSNGPHPATGGFEIGDPALRKEVSTSLEASAHYAGDAWSFDAHAFAVRYRDFIDLHPVGALEPDSGLRVFRYVQARARFHGGEAEASYRAWSQGARSLHVEWAADYVRGESDLGPAVRVPPWSITGRAVLESPAWSGRLELRKVGAQRRVAVLELPTDGHVTVDAGLTFRPLGSKRDLRVYVEGRNLTDAEAREHVSFLKDVAPLPGRNLRLGFGYRF